MKVWQPAHWYFSLAKNAWCLTKAGEREMAEEPEIQLEINAREVEMLIKELDQEGWIKPRLDDRIRAEDLKITHRLLDIIETNVKGS